MTISNRPLISLHYVQREINGLEMVVRSCMGWMNLSTQTAHPITKVQKFISSLDF